MNHTNPVRSHVIYQIQNTPRTETPDIAISEHDNDWESVLARWKDMKNPTNSPLWKKGVYALTKVVYYTS